jgi:hypothetical protein
MATVGTFYTEYLIPPSTQVGYRPSIPQLEAILAGLVEYLWIDPAAKKVIVSTGRREHSTFGFRDGCKRFLESAGNPAGVRADFPSLPHERWWAEPTDPKGRSRRYELEETDRFAPQYCETVTLVLVPKPLMVPADGRSIHCPRCRTWQQGSEDIFGVGEVLPLTCPKCSAALDPQHLAARTHSPIDGVPRDEPAPFFCFATILEPAPRASAGAFPVQVDEHLLGLLKRATGLDFRNLSRWG